MIGGMHVVSGTYAVPVKLSNDDRPCRILTIRLNVAASRVEFGDDSIDGESHGYLVATATAGESWTFGPYGAGFGIKASEVFIWGTAGDIVYWNGLEA